MWKPFPLSILVGVDRYHLYTFEVEFDNDTSYVSSSANISTIVKTTDNCSGLIMPCVLVYLNTVSHLARPNPEHFL